ncbi:MAG TPA: serine/threonine-protein kinase [Kofleriaceae bacterium]|jgi:serine/threonine-protein kinase
MSSSAASRRASTISGQHTIGSYDIISKLATGGMGEVYLAKQRGPVAFSRDVVLKKLHPSFTDDPHFVEMFINEAKLSATLTHPNIIHIYELFEDDGYVMAMEYVRGGTVLRLLRAAAKAGNALPYGPALRIGIGVCEALDHAYNSPDSNGAPHRIVHRDVSPSNILVSYDGQVKLADFGIAKAIDVNMTQGTSVKGKYGYLSPEQLRCHPLDQRSDLFSIGVVLWEMTTGRSLFRRDNDVAMMYALVEESIPRPSEKVADYPADLEAIVMKALERDRERRYDGALDLANDLRRVAHEHGWDVEGPALSQLVRDQVPDDQVAFGRIGSDKFTGPETPQPRASDLYDAVAVEVDTPVLRKPARSRAVVVTTGVMLLLSILFWVLIVPHLV